MISAILIVLAVICSLSNAADSCSSLGLHFYTWDGEMSCDPSQYLTPRSEKEVVEIVMRASENKENLKVIGGGLSFSGVQLVQNGAMMSLDKMDKILNVKPANDGSGDSFVEVQAGIRVRDLVDLLELRELAMINLGATASQSIVGAMSTGTHGTGSKLGGLATQAIALRIVDAHGEIRFCTATENSELFHAARVSVGALGIITSVTIRVVPQFKLKMTSTPISFTQLLEDLPALLEKHDRLQWHMLPYTDYDSPASAAMVVREEVPFSTPITPPGPEGGCWGNNKTNPCTDLSYKTLTDNLEHYNARTLYTEMEMFVPLDVHIEAIKEFVAWMETDEVKSQHNPDVYIQLMLRYVASDDILLSPSGGRPTAVMSFIAQGGENNPPNQADFELFARGMQAVAEKSAFQGRVHWGKVNYLSDSKAPAQTQSTPEYLEQAYGKENWQRFRQMRDKMDPHRMFQNEYLRERLGE